MRHALVLSLALVTACSSSTAPDHAALSGTWQVTTNTLGTGLSAVHLTLTQMNDAITGTALVQFIGGRPSLTLQVNGKSGLDGSMSCFPEPPMGNCHVNFQFTATDADGDDLYFQGQSLNNDLLTGDVQSSPTLGFQNVDGRVLQFSRVTRSPNPVS